LCGVKGYAFVQMPGFLDLEKKLLVSEAKTVLSQQPESSSK
jgi:hypothetical protein